VQPGDVILAINETPVRSVRELRASAMRLDQDSTAALLIEREGAQIFVPIRTGRS
jgi:serine protease Do